MLLLGVLRVGHPSCQGSVDYGDHVLTAAVALAHAITAVRVHARTFAQVPTHPPVGADVFSPYFYILNSSQSKLPIS